MIKKFENNNNYINKVVAVLRDHSRCSEICALNILERAFVMWRLFCFAASSTPNHKFTPNQYFYLFVELRRGVKKSSG